MAHPFTESLSKIEATLIELTKKNKRSCFQKEIIDNDEFQQLFNVSQGTAENWRKQGLIAYFQINSKIYFKVKDVERLIEEHYKPLKKK